MSYDVNPFWFNSVYAAKQTLLWHIQEQHHLASLFFPENTSLSSTSDSDYTSVALSTDTPTSLDTETMAPLTYTNLLVILALLALILCRES